jgi:ubiquinone/menaquinone biosynthesis C-methylase UbiE
VERLIHGRELLDGPLDDERALAGNLRDLRRINRLFGGVALTRRATERLLRATEGRTAEGLAAEGDLRFLDVGTGGADIPAALAASGVAGRRLRATAVDSRPEVLTLARAWLGDRGVELALADGRRLPYPDAAFDVVHASLVLHHLDEADGAALLREMARVARLGVVVNDLSRGRLAWLGAWLVGHVLTANRLTRADAPTSVRRAYTRAEMTALLARAGLRPIALVTGFAGHRYAIAAVRA